MNNLLVAAAVAAIGLSSCKGAPPTAAFESVGEIPGPLAWNTEPERLTIFSWSLRVSESGLHDHAQRILEAGEYRAALGIYQRLLWDQPANVDALYGAALAAHELKQDSRSATYVERTLAVEPNHPLAHLLAGFQHQLAKRYGQARAHYLRFLSVETTGARADEIRAVLASMPHGTTSTSVAGAR
jgi:tetratricopeptide (TPR) repeat protein